MLETLLGIAVFWALSILIAQVVRLKYYQARFLSLLLVCLIAFVFSHFFPFKYVLYTVLIIFCGAGVWMIWSRGFLMDKKAEAVFVAAFIYFLFLRSLIPDAIGAEKLMDVAFMNSVLQATSFPPPDPFFAGGSLNFYYYFGYVVGAGVTLMSFVNPEVGFNVGTATIAAFSCLLVYGLLQEILQDGRKAIIGVIFVLFAGNLYAAYDLFTNAIAMEMPGYLFYWDPTRVIENTINEFPYFSFIHADFHAHVVAIPIKILGIALLYDYRRIEGVSLSGLALVPISFILFAANSWDAPLFLFLIALTFVVKILPWLNVSNIMDSLRSIRTEILFASGIILASVLSILLFYSTMETPSAELIVVEERSSLIQFLLFFFIQLAFGFFYLRDEVMSRLFVFSVFPAAVLSLWVPISIVTIPLAVLSARKAVKGDFFAVLVFAASLLMLAPEVIAIESRLNTVFKFYLAVWTLITIPGALALSQVIKGIKGHKNHSRIVTGSLLILFILSLIYPVMATPARHYKADFHLDGMEFVKDYSEGDYLAIQWLRDRDRVEREVILEEAYDCYDYGGRMAAFTANPTLVGWACHEVQWRGNGMELAQRQGAVRAIYTSENCSLITDTLDKYNITLVIVGYQEEKEYGTEPQKFEKCGLKEVFASRGTHIYKVDKSDMRS
ncbi:MAG: DUF2298 domain-containing protein [Halobacteriota archaeon]